MDDKSDPMNGWPILEVLGSDSFAREDRYGKLFAFLHIKFSLFLQRLSSQDVHFEFHCTNATELSKLLSRNSYDRIEVSIPTKHFPTQASDCPGCKHLRFVLPWD
jgi:hypothetical protein